MTSSSNRLAIGLVLSCFVCVSASRASRRGVSSSGDILEPGEHGIVSYMPDQSAIVEVDAQLFCPQSKTITRGDWLKCRSQCMSEKSKCHYWYKWTKDNKNGILLSKHVGYGDTDFLLVTIMQGYVEEMDEYEHPGDGNKVYSQLIQKEKKNRNLEDGYV